MRLSLAAMLAIAYCSLGDNVIVLHTARSQFWDNYSCFGTSANCMQFLSELDISVRMRACIQCGWKWTFVHVLCVCFLTLQAKEVAIEWPAKPHQRETWLGISDQEVAINTVLGLCMPPLYCRSPGSRIDRESHCAVTLGAIVQTEGCTVKTSVNPLRTNLTVQLN